MSPLLTVLATLGAVNQDPLFLSMEGCWSAEGVRTHEASGNQSRVAGQIEVKVKNGILVSRSLLTETSTEGGEGQTYQRQFWVRPTARTGQYELGGRPVKTDGLGRLVEDHFFAERRLGAKPASVLRLEASFDDEGMDYTEQQLQEGKLHSVIKLRYIRVMPLSCAR